VHDGRVYVDPTVTTTAPEPTDDPVDAGLRVMPPLLRRRCVRSTAPA
jgi:hypothetical protein